MKSLAILLISTFLPLLINAQTTITWTGSTPGKETKWNEPKNWDAYRIPNEDDKVIIKMDNNSHFSQPVINEEVHIVWLEIHAGAELTITTTGQLILDGSYTYSQGISMYGGNLSSEGEIIFKNIEAEYIANLSPINLSEKINYYSKLHGYEFSIVSSFNTTK